MSLREPPYPYIVPFAHALVAAVPDRLVWGPDWPRVLLGKTMPDDRDLVDQIPAWVPDDAVRKRILVATRSGPYGFEGA
jgi:2-pyrone-4,6-dicarboxylate lactonase